MPAARLLRYLDFSVSHGHVTKISPRLVTFPRLQRRDGTSRWAAVRRSGESWRADPVGSRLRTPHLTRNLDSRSGVQIPLRLDSGAGGAFGGLGSSQRLAGKDAFWVSVTSS
jgi:hypothetical protein